MYRFDIWATTSSGPLTGSKALETTIYDGGGKKIDSVQLFNLFKGKNAPASSLKDLAEAGKTLTNLVSGGGSKTKARQPSGKPNIYKCTEEEFVDLLPQVDQILQDCEHHAQRVENDLPYLFDRIRQSYTDPATGSIPYEIADLINTEERKIMARFKREALIPVFGSEDIYKTRGVVGQSEHEDLIAQAVARSELQTTMQMVGWAEELLIAALEDIKKGVQRGRSQGSKLLKAIENCQNLVSEFSDKPDLIADMQATLAKAKQIDTTTEGLKDEQAKALASDALAIFERPSVVNQAEPEITEDEPCSQCGNEDPCRFCGKPYTPEPELAITYEPTLSETIERPRGKSQLMEELFGEPVPLEMPEITAEDCQIPEDPFADEPNPSHDTETGDVVINTNKPLTYPMEWDDEDMF